MHSGKFLNFSQKVNSMNRFIKVEAFLNNLKSLWQVLTDTDIVKYNALD